MMPTRFDVAETETTQSSDMDVTDSLKFTEVNSEVCYELETL